MLYDAEALEDEFLRNAPPVPAGGAKPAPASRIAGAHYERKVTDDYALRQMVGKGAFGIVRLGVSKETGRKVAVKVISNRYTDNAMLQRELATLQRIKRRGGHTNIIDFEAAYWTEENFYLVTELVAGGELFEHLVRNGAFSEAEAARLLREVARALRFLHGFGITHGDLKPENLVLSAAGRDSGAHVKLIDFGCAVTEGADELSLNTAGQSTTPGEVGTPAYASPELLVSGECSPGADVWALGVILYTMLAGTHPFSDADEEAMQAHILREQLDFTHPLWSNISDSAKHLIQQLCQKDQDARYDVHQLLAHPWLTGETASDAVLAGSDQRLNEFNLARQRLRAQVLRLLVKKATQRRRTRNLSDGAGVHAACPAAAGGAESAAGSRALHSEAAHRGDAAGLLLPHNSTQDQDSAESRIYPSTADRRQITDLGGELQVVSNAFAIFDRDKKGYISQEDLRAAMEEVGEGDLSEAELALIISNAALHSSAGKLRYEDYNAVMAELAQVHYKDGDVVFEQGDEAHNFYFISSGEVEVVARVGNQEAVLGTLGEGEYFGEQAMLSEARRNATVRCLTPVTLITLGSDDFKALMGDRDSTMASGVAQESEHRAIELVKTLIAMTSNIQGQIERQVLRRGEVVFREGEPGDCMFSIIRGNVAITASMPEQRLPPSAISEAVRLARRKSVHNKSVMVATMKEGDVFGERALMAGERRNATVCCDADECELAVLRKKDFVQLMAGGAETGMNAIRRKHEVPPSKPLGDAAASVA